MPGRPLGEELVVVEAGGRRRAGAPVDREASVHGRSIAVKIPTEAPEFWWAGAVNIGDAVFDLASTSLADQDHELLRQTPARGQLAAPATQVCDEHAFRIVELAAAAQQQPAPCLRTRQDASDGWWWLRLAPTLHESSDRSLAAAIAECLELIVQKRGNVTTLLPAAHEIWSESIKPTWAFSSRTA